MSNAGLRSSTFYLSDDSTATYVDDKGVSLDLNETNITNVDDIKELAAWLDRIAEEL